MNTKIYNASVALMERDALISTKVLYRSSRLPSPATHGWLCWKSRGHLISRMPLAYPFQNHVSEAIRLL